jgi:outer membrane protein
MKNLVRVLIFCLVIFSGCLTAQTLKFGHIDFQQLITAMPEREVATTSFEKVRSDLESKFQAMQKEYSEKDKEYTALTQAKDPIEAIIKVKLDEIQSLQVRIQTFQQTAQESLQKEETKLMQPLLEKARKAINDVAKELGLIYVFEENSSRSSVLYHSEQSIDLTLLVKAKLGIVK